MIKILHTGDIHLGSLTGPEKNGINLRREDTLRCMDEIVQTAREERPDLTIIAGDLFNRSRVWADTALDDVRDAVERLLRPLCECSGHVVLLFGTANHDNPKAFENIFTMTNDLENLNVDTAPALYRLRCNDGSWVQIMSVPGFDKGRLRTFCPGMDKEAENFNATALINDTIMGLAGRCDKHIPTILTAHYTVAGAEADNGSTFLAGQDVVVLPATIDAAGVDLACLGHIHRPQKIACNTPAYYCGCINELTFNDEATRHGFYIHTMDGHGIVKSEFHELESSRKHYTMRIDRPQIMQFIADGTLNIAADQVYGKIVRVRYSCISEEEKALNKAELQQKLMEMGAFYISDILPEDVEELDAKDQLTEHDGPTEALSRWLDLNNVEPWQKARLMELASPIIAKADHGMDDGHSTGAFLPISIEVKNYRSYTDAAFSFEPVHMAMVNGANGVGKSSLFMDAIADCLYEQTRKEDIGGWVREGTKSGSIIFTFAMGEKKYRVVRTRTASGRGTLALQCFNAENQEWADGSDTTMRLTQTKIERLLGMDCNTFCSIALIRQDAYGLFLDADSDRRMEVLSALLGLDLYNRMAEITAAESKEQRRTIASAKDMLTVYTDEIAHKEELQSAQDAAKAKIAEAEQQIASADKLIADAKAKQAAYDTIMQQITSRGLEISECDDQIAAKSATVQNLLTVKIPAAHQAASGEKLAREASEALPALCDRERELIPADERCKALLAERDQLSKRAEQRVALHPQLNEQRQKAEQIVAMKDQAKADEAELAQIAQRCAELDVKIQRADELAKQVETAKMKLTEAIYDAKEKEEAIQRKIDDARNAAKRLELAKCPMEGEATCVFLASATEAARQIGDLEYQLQVRKSQNDTAIKSRRVIVNETQAALDALNNPRNERGALELRRSALYSSMIRMEAVEAAQQQLKEIAQRQAEIVNETFADRKRMNEISAVIESLSGAMEELKALQGKIKQTEMLAAKLPEAVEAREKGAAMKADANRLQQEVLDLARRKDRLLEEKNSLMQSLPGMDDTSDLERGRNKAAQVQRLATISLGSISAKLERIADAEEKAADLRETIKKTAKLLDDYQVLAQAFSLDGIQYMIVRGVVPEIMRRSNDILAAMTGGRMAVDIRTERELKSTKQIVNSLEVWISSINGGHRPYQSHSGGEKVKIALAVTLGLADVKAHRAGVQIGMLHIDEPPFLDAAGTEAYADALLNMAQRNPNMRILAISHDPTMKARFPQTITVEAGENGSTAYME